MTCKPRFNTTQLLSCAKTRKKNFPSKLRLLESNEPADFAGQVAKRQEQLLRRQAILNIRICSCKFRLESKIIGNTSGKSTKVWQERNYKFPRLE